MLLLWMTGLARKDSRIINILAVEIAEQRLPKICAHLLTGVYLVGYCFLGAEAQLLSVPRHRRTDGRYTPCGCLVTQWPRSGTSSKS